MANPIELEDVIEIHPLDEVGRDINEILQLGHELIRTDNGETYARAIRIGCISIFLARFTSESRSTFTVGFDFIKDDEFIAMSDDFKWDILRPEDTKDKEEDIEKLGELVRQLGYLGA